MGPHAPTPFPPWEVRHSYATHHAYSLATNAERPELISQRSMIGFIVAIVGFALAFGGTLGWRAHTARASSVAAASAMAVEVAPTEVAPVDSPSAFEPPPPTIALSASVGEPSPPPPAVAKSERRHKGKAEMAKVVHAAPADISAAASADGATRKRVRKPRRVTAD
jgi:hypothetical protein